VEISYSDRRVLRQGDTAGVAPVHSPDPTTTELLPFTSTPPWLVREEKSITISGRIQRKQKTNLVFIAEIPVLAVLTHRSDHLSKHRRSRRHQMCQGKPGDLTPYSKLLKGQNYS
jgi:hypothetical protein